MQRHAERHVADITYMIILGIYIYRGREEWGSSITEAFGSVRVTTCASSPPPPRHPYTILRWRGKRGAIMRAWSVTPVRVAEFKWIRALHLYIYYYYYSRGIYSPDALRDRPYKLCAMHTRNNTALACARFCPFITPRRTAAACSLSCFTSESHYIYGVCYLFFLFFFVL